jgi:hypothetical protein
MLQTLSAIPAAIAGDPQRLMNPSKVVMDEVQSHRSRVIFDLLGRGIPRPPATARHLKLRHYPLLSSYLPSSLQLHYSVNQRR